MRTKFDIYVLLSISNPRDVLRSEGYFDVIVSTVSVLYVKKICIALLIYFSDKTMYFAMT